MDLNKLKSFYTVAKLKSFSKAAELLFLTQPAVSTQIKDLEYEYRTKLFDRIGNKIQLTQSGEKLIPYVKSLLDIYEESHFELNHLKEAKDGTIKLGVSGFPGARLLPSIISAFKKEYKDVHFTIKEQKSAIILQSTSQNHFDLGLIVNSEKSIERKDLQERVLYKDKMVIGVSKEHFLADKKIINIKELSRMPLIVSKKDTVARKVLNRFFNENLIPFNIAYEIESKSMIKTMVEKNLGIAFFNSLEIKEEIKSGLIHILELKGFSLSMYVQIIQNKKKELSPTAKAFYDFIFDSKKQKLFFEDI